MRAGGLWRMSSGLSRNFVMKEIRWQEIPEAFRVMGSHGDHHWINVAANFKLDRTAALVAGCQVCTAGAKFVLAIGP